MLKWAAARRLVQILPLRVNVTNRPLRAADVWMALSSVIINVSRGKSVAARERTRSTILYDIVNINHNSPPQNSLFRIGSYFWMKLYYVNYRSIFKNVFAIISRQFSWSLYYFCNIACCFQLGTILTSSDCKIVQQCKFEGGKTEFKTIVQRPGCGELKTCVVINGSPTCVCKTGYIQDGRNGCLSKKYLLFLLCNTSIF